MMKKIIVFTILTFTIHLSQAAVWETKPGLHWDSFWNMKYQEWIKNKVQGDFFKQLGGKYKDLPLDCADAMYGLKVYFSYLNRLPWKSDAYKWNKRESNPYGYSNHMTNWDYLPNENDRVAHLIGHLIDRVGTESLANLDTYSIALSDVKPGDVFMYKVGSDGSFTRHTYIVKSVNKDGTFDVLYATQLRAKKLQPLGRIGNEYLQHKPDRNNWGFKRYKSDLDISIRQDKLPGHNPEQYEVAKRVSESEFFDYVNTSLRIYKETPKRKTERLLSGLCRSLRARQIVVNDAINWQRENVNRCMAFQDFDAYSTPSRDAGILKKYVKLKNYFQILEAKELKNKVPEYLSRIVNRIYQEQELNNNDQEVLNKYCQVSVQDGAYQAMNINLGSFYQSLIKGEVSSHPNDNKYQRWGAKVGQKTSCEAFY